MKYFLKYSYFIGITLAFAALISLLTRGIRYELLPIFTLLAFIVKLFDDYHNFDNDKLLEKPTMRMLLILFCVGFFILNIFCYKATGLICIVPLAYALLQTHFDVMKLFFLTINSALFLAIYTKLEGLWIIIFLCGTFVLSAGLFIFKYLRLSKR